MKNLHFYLKEKKNNGVNKLVTTLKNKKRYVVHLVTLKQALNYGIKLKNIHRVIEFKQDSWLEPYISMNNDYRKKAKNEFEKYFFKLMNNSVFGKTMENFREHKDIKLVNNIDSLNKYAREPNMKNIKYFSDNLLAIEMKKTEIIMNKPVYLGQAILDINKTIVCGFYYGYIKPKYNNKVKLAYMDTDSFIMQIFTDDFYNDISPDINEWFDTSCYSNKPIKIGVNKKVLGMFKDETGDNEIIESVNVCAKLYSFVSEVKEEKKAKGIKKCVKKKCTKFQGYVDAIKLSNIKRCVQTVIRSYRHNVYTEDVNKIAISASDDKRIWLKDVYDMTYQYGSPTLKKLLSVSLFFYFFIII